VYDTSEAALLMLNGWHVQLVVGVTWAIMAVHLVTRAKRASQMFTAQAIGIKGGGILAFTLYAEVVGPSTLFATALVAFMCVWLVLTGSTTGLARPGASMAAWGGDACVIGYALLHFSGDLPLGTSLSGQLCSAVGLLLMTLGGVHAFWRLIRPVPRLREERETA
jgi:hypothetical protein